ncbi:MAG TPA: putative Ig domain-containing protein [Chthoniobacteraceae bacterium]|jgi:hypothetical protein|nr:putative Ig domain-containing protein [Chthoniobacteraceae bacterium]
MSKPVINVSAGVAGNGIFGSGGAYGDVGAAFSYQITATNTPTSYNATNLPAGLSVNTSTGAITGTPTATGTTSVTLSATNGSGTGTATLSVAVGSLPVITSALTATASLGSLDYVASASNMTGAGALGYNVTCPDGVTFTGAGLGASDGGITYYTSPSMQFAFANAGTFDITIEALNLGGTGTATLVVSVPPVFYGPVSMAATVGVSASYQIVTLPAASSFSATGLPSALSIDSSTGIISGTPAAAGSTVASITASSAGGNVTESFTVNVYAAMSITSASTLSAVSGVTATYQITASGAPASYAATGLPPGMSVNGSTGVISGTPTSTGTFTATVAAINPAQTVSATLTITVTATAAVPVVATSYPSISFFSGATFTITNGAPTSIALAASNSPTSWAATGLPSGLSIDTSTGIVSGTVSSNGVTAFSVAATNGAGAGAAQAFNISVVADPDAVPVIQVPAGLPTVNVPSGGIGLPAFAQYSPFNYQFYATNSPTSWTLAGAPEGVTIATGTGVLSATATPPGYYVFAVSAANASGSSTPVPVAMTVTVGTGVPQTAGPVPWLTNGLTIVDLQFNLAYPRAVSSSCAPLNFYQGDGLILGLLLLTPAGPAYDATSIWLSGRVAVDTEDLLRIALPAAQPTEITGGEYYALPVNLASAQIAEALADMNEPTGGTPAVLTLQCQLGVLRANGLTYRSAPFTITITQRLVDAGLPPLDAD